MSKPVIFLAAGASGGHISPAIALGEELQEKFSLVFVGSGKPIEKKIYGSEGIDYQVVPSTPILGKGILGLVKFTLSFPSSLYQGIHLLRKHRAVLLVAFGGYPSFIPALSAFLLRIPVILQEQNIKMGLANKMLAKIARVVVASPAAELEVPEKSVYRIGNPVRRKFRQARDNNSSPSKEEKKLKVLFLGGSQGAKCLNDLWLNSQDLFQNLGIETEIQTGKRDFERVSEAKPEAKTNIHAFYEDIEKRLAWADLVVCRAGAMTVAELSAVGRTAIFIPLKIAKAHQSDNISELVSSGAAWTIEESDNLFNDFSDILEGILAQPETLRTKSMLMAEFSEVGGLSNSAALAKFLEEKVLSV